MTEPSRRGNPSPSAATGWLRVASLVGLAVVLVAFLVPLDVPAQSQTFTQLRVSPPQGPPGTRVLATGTNFDFYCDVEIYLLGSEDGSRARVAFVPSRDIGFDGGFEVRFTVPDLAPGPYRVDAVSDCRSAGTGFDIRTLTVDPPASRVGRTVTVIGEGFLHPEECGDVLRIVVAGAVVRETRLIPDDDESWVVSFRATFTMPNRPPGTYVVQAIQLMEGYDGGGPERSPCAPTGEDLRATTTLRILAPDEPDPDPRPRPRPRPRPDPDDPDAPALDVDPDRGEIGTEVEVAGARFETGLSVTIDIGGEALVTVPGGQVTGGGFTVDAEIPEGTPGGDQEVTACQRCGTAVELVAITTFTVLPRLSVDPGLARLGSVVQASGDGFPADMLVELRWQPGIGLVRITSDDAGTFRVAVLVFHRDLLGERQLLATVPGAPQPEDDEEEPDEPPAAPLLVVPGTLQPPSFSTRR